MLSIAQGRTNVELREQLYTPEGAAQVMQAFKAKRRDGTPSSGGRRTLSPSPSRQLDRGAWLGGGTKY